MSSLFEVLVNLCKHLATPTHIPKS